MRVTTNVMFAPLAAASIAMKHGMVIDSAAAPFSSNATGPSCGIGYTYCGYILKKEKRTHIPCLAHSMSSN